MKPILSLEMQQTMIEQVVEGGKYCTLCHWSSEIPGGALICNYQAPGYPTGINIKEVRKKGGLCGWKDPKHFKLDEKLQAMSSASGSRG